MSARAVFLDRDGVLNRAFVREGRPFPPASVLDLELLPDAPDSCAMLRAAGFRLVVVTNQPDVARRTQTRAAVEAIHAALAKRLPIDEFRVCYHDDSDGCACRKPLPGLLLGAATDRDLSLNASFMVGDRWRDIDAGHHAGCRTVFIDRGYVETLREPPDNVVASLGEATRWILGQENQT